MSADIINLSDYRTAQVAEVEIDIVTAVDVAVRDLRQILLHWPSEEAREQLQQWSYRRILVTDGVRRQRFELAI